MQLKMPGFSCVLLCKGVCEPSRICYPVAFGPNGGGLFWVSISRPGPTCSVLVGLADLLPPIASRKKNQKEKEKNILSGSVPGSLLRCGLELRLHLPALSSPLQSPGPPGTCLLVLRALLRLVLCIVVKAISTQNPRPRGFLVGAHPFRCGWGVL